MTNNEDARTSSPWTGWRDFTIAGKQPESEVITSFRLVPADGGPVAPHLAGQHLTFDFDIAGRKVGRNYTISSAPNGRDYRITVKREPKGMASRWLHDEAAIGTAIRVAAPSGSFVLPESRERPLVLLSGGVGLTPMVAMLEAIAEEDGPGREVHFVHSALHGGVHAMGGHVRSLADGHDGIRVTTFYSEPRPRDEAGRDFDQSGFITLDWLRDNTPIDRADYFVCGPVPFLRNFVTGLTEAGVPRERIHYEFFGTAGDLVDQWPDAPAGGETADTAENFAARRVEGPDIGEDEIALALARSQADAVVASDAGGMIVYWNAGAERIFGFTAEEAVGQSLDIIIPENLRARHWEGYHHTVATGQSRYGAGDLLAVPGQHKDGQRLSLEFTIVLMHGDDGRTIGMVSSLRDVTKRFEETRALKKRLAEIEGAKS